MDLRAHSSTSGITEFCGPFDLAVVGGGLAGICAALAAARQGSKVALINDRPVLGGASSTEIRIPLSGAGDHNAWCRETGIIDELVTEERARSHDGPGYALMNAHWDLLLYEACRAEPNLTLFQNTSVRQVESEPVPGGKRLVAVLGVQLGTEKVLCIAARLFVDATGDGVVVAEAGAPWRWGREARGEFGEFLAPREADDEVLGSSLSFRARDVGHPVPFEPPAWAVTYPDEASLSYRVHRPIEGGYWWIELGYPRNIVHDNEEIRDELLRHVLGVWDHIKNHCEDRAAAANYALDWVGMLPGKRESRRAVGAYVMTETDALSQELFWDRIGYGGWMIDDHERKGIVGRDLPPTKGIFISPFSVPLRSLIAGPSVPNLLLAGRIISVSRIVFLSLRVQLTLGALGQATGTAAALCAERNLLPTELGPAEAKEIQQRLLKHGCYVPFVRNEDPADLARAARITASSEAALALEPDESPEAAVELKVDTGQVIPLTSTRLDTVTLYLENRSAEPRTVRLRLLPARDVWDLDVFDSWQLPEVYGVKPKARPELVASAEVSLPAGFAGWATFSLEASVPPNALVWLILGACPGVYWRMARDVPPGTIGANPGAKALEDVAPEDWLKAGAQITGEDWWVIPNSRRGVPYVERDLWRSLAVRLSPPSAPFGPANAVNGSARPDVWSNAWISDPEQPFPQWLELDLGEARDLNTVILTFDTNLNRSRWYTPALWRAPECVRDYTLSVLDEGSGAWVEVLRVAGNYQRRRAHRFPAVRARRVRLNVLATNGARSATVYEARLYHE